MLKINGVYIGVKLGFQKVYGKDDEDICAAFAAETDYAFVESVCDSHRKTEIELNPIFVFGQFYFSDFLRSGRAMCQVPKLFFEKKRIRGGVIFPFVFFVLLFFSDFYFR